MKISTAIAYSRENYSIISLWKALKLLQQNFKRLLDLMHIIGFNIRKIVLIKVKKCPLRLDKPWFSIHYLCWDTHIKLTANIQRAGWSWQFLHNINILKKKSFVKSMTKYSNFNAICLWFLLIKMIIYILIPYNLIFCKGQVIMWTILFLFILFFFYMLARF